MLFVSFSAILLCWAYFLSFFKCPPTTFLFSIYQSIHPFTQWSIHPSSYPSAHTPIFPHIHASGHPPICLGCPGISCSRICLWGRQNLPLGWIALSIPPWLVAQYLLCSIHPHSLKHSSPSMFLSPDFRCWVRPVGRSSTDSAEEAWVHVGMRQRPPERAFQGVTTSVWLKKWSPMHLAVEVLFTNIFT